MVKIPDEECAIPDLVDGEDGKNLVTRKTITTDEFLREVRYVIEVTNDPKQEDTVRWIYTTAINFNGTCTTVTESGSITGMGSPQKNQAGKAPDFEKYRQAKNKWDEIKGGIRGRLLGATSIESDFGNRGASAIKIYSCGIYPPYSIFLFWVISDLYYVSYFS